MNPTPRVDVQAFLNKHPFSGFQWVIFALCFIVVLADGFDTAAIGFIAPSLIGEWGVERPALGPVLSAALFGLAFGALCSGPLADHYGYRRTLLVCLLAVVTSSLVTGLAATLPLLILAALVGAVGRGPSCRSHRPLWRPPLSTTRLAAMP